MPATVGYPQLGKVRKSLSKEVRERLEDARLKLKFGMDYRQAVRETEWRQSYEQYMNAGDWGTSAGDPTADIVNVNISFSTINTLVPFVADENPKFLVEPFSSDATPEAAGLIQVFINRLWESDEIMGQIHLRDSVFDHLVYGDGFIKVGYQIEERPTIDASGRAVPNSEQDIAHFTVERVSPWDIWVDPYSDGLHNARWVAHRFMMPVSELKRDNRFRVVDPDMLGGGSDVSLHAVAPEDMERNNYMRSNGGWVTIFEYWDLKEKWSMAFPFGGSGDTIFRYVEWTKCPIVQIPNYRIPNSPYHIGELENISALQNELNKTRSQMITHRRRNALKWMYRRNALQEDAINALQSEKIGIGVPIDGNDPFERLLAPIDARPLSADTYQIDAQIHADVNEITGVNEYLRGSPPDIRRTATEASIIEGATNVRTRHKLLQIETAARQIGQLLLDVMTDVIPQTDFQEMNMYITGREAQKLNALWGQDDVNTDILFSPQPEIFEGKYVVFVERGSVELRNPTAKAQKYKEIVQIILASYEMLSQLGIQVNVRRLMEIWFQAEGITDTDEIFTQDEDVLMQQQMQQQMLLAQQQAPQGGAGAQLGMATQPGNARGVTATPPTDIINETNSGQLPARPY